MASESVCRNTNLTSFAVGECAAAAPMLYGPHSTPSQTENGMQAPPAAYNVFRRKRKPALHCAVRQDRPVPTFVNGETWDFGGIATMTEPPPGFQPEAAHEAMRLTGYYLFHALQA
ncbi:hypothetical protein [Methylobacterium nigriterrae]|uniref:hypothetical protein n=1 Tax=Methylobacterium nigriterrae TaxID=3127512 RepID=UPI003013449A